MQTNKGHSTKEILEAAGILVVTYFVIFFLGNIMSSMKKAEIPDSDSSTEMESNFTKDYSYSNFRKNKALNPIIYDPIYVWKRSFEDLIVDNEIDEQLSFEELKSQLAIKSYKVNQDLCLWNEEDNFDALYGYNMIKTLPYQLAKRIIPQSIRKNQLIINKTFDAYIKDGVKIDATIQVYRKIEKIYSINEKSDHIQLLVLGYGEIYPTIQLITLNKNNFEFVDKVIVYRMESNDKELIRIKGCLNDTFEVLNIKEIHSYEQSNDTIEYKYEILKSGKIELMN